MTTVRRARALPGKDIAVGVDRAAKEVAGILMFVEAEMLIVRISIRSHRLAFPKTGMASANSGWK